MWDVNSSGLSLHDLKSDHSIYFQSDTKLPCVETWGKLGNHKKVDTLVVSNNGLDKKEYGFHPFDNMLDLDELNPNRAMQHFKNLTSFENDVFNIVSNLVVAGGSKREAMCRERAPDAS